MSALALLLFAFAGVLLAAFASAADVSLFSLRRIEREQVSKGESWSDRRLMALHRGPRRMMTAIRIASLLGTGLLFIATLQLIRLSGWPAPLLTFLAIGAAALVKVALCDILPKALAAKASLRWARRLIGAATVWELVVWPVTWPAMMVVDGFLRTIGESARPRAARDLTEDEFQHLVATAGQGQVAASERRLIDRVFKFAEKNVGQIMTPRDRVFALSYDLPMARLVREVASHGFSRVPIYQKSLDNVRGILNAKDLLRAPGKPLANLLHEPLFVPRTTPVKRLFIQFKQKKIHFGVVVNEYGGVLGVVTMDDVLAQLFGAIRDERESLQAIPRQIRMERTPPSGIAVDPGDLITPTPNPSLHGTPPLPAAADGPNEPSELAPRSALEEKA